MAWRCLAVAGCSGGGRLGRLGGDGRLQRCRISRPGLAVPVLWRRVVGWSVVTGCVLWIILEDGPVWHRADQSSALCSGVAHQCPLLLLVWELAGWWCAGINAKYCGSKGRGASAAEQLTAMRRCRSAGLARCFPASQQQGAAHSRRGWLPQPACGCQAAGGAGSNPPLLMSHPFSMGVGKPMGAAPGQQPDLVLP